MDVTQGSCCRLVVQCCHSDWRVVRQLYHVTVMYEYLLCCFIFTSWIWCRTSLHPEKCIFRSPCLRMWYKPSVMTWPPVCATLIILTSMKGRIWWHLSVWVLTTMTGPLAHLSTSGTSSMTSGELHSKF